MGDGGGGAKHVKFTFICYEILEFNCNLFNVKMREKRKRSRSVVLPSFLG